MITAKLLREWHTCWDGAKIAAYLAGRPFVTLRQVASDASLSHGDRLWVISHAMYEIDERACRLYAIESAMRMTPQAGDEDDQALHAAILSELIEIEDRPESERVAAWVAARDAAWDAVWGAARTAARTAAWDAVWDAAGDIARDAAWGVARAAARDTAWYAARAADWGAELDNAIARALEWLGDWADATKIVGEP